MKITKRKVDTQTNTLLLTGLCEDGSELEVRIRQTELYYSITLEAPIKLNVKKEKELPKLNDIDFISVFTLSDGKLLSRSVVVKEKKSEYAMRKALVGCEAAFLALKRVLESDDE